MVTVINFIWQSIFCLAFLYGLYWVFLKNEKTFHFNRIFLLLAPVLAFVFPLIKIPVSFDKPSISLEGTSLLKAFKIQDNQDIIGTFGLPEVTVTGSKLPLLWGIMDYLLLTYLLIIAFLLLKLFYQYIQLRQLLEKGWYQTVYKLKGDYFLVPTFGLAPIFSFFDKIFWDDTQTLSPIEEKQIIQHELEHIRQKHTWDILYYQILSVLFWFNPFLHLMRMSLVDLHEYLADEKVLNHTESKGTYPKLIVKMAFKGLDLPIGNYFIRSTTLKRIMMMKKKSKINWFRLAMVIPLLGMLFGLVSMKSHDRLKLFHKYETTPVIQLKQQLKAVQDSLDVSIKVRSLKQPEHYEWIGTFENGQLTAQLGELEYEFSEISSMEEYLKVRSLINALRSSSKMTKTYENVKVQYKVEHPPKPENGWDHWENFLTSQVKAPTLELDLGISGTLELEYIVNREGKITNPIVRQSFGGGLDQQVLDLLQHPNVPSWEPGKEGGYPVNTVVNTKLGFNTSDPSGKAHEFFLVKSGPYDTPKDLSGYGDSTVFQVAEKMPVPAGGMEGWLDYISTNLKYPSEAKNRGKEGTVYLSFIVSKTGDIENIELLRSIDRHLEQEAIRLLSEAPNWYPGEQRGKKVAVKMRVPIRFKLAENKSESPRSSRGYVQETNDIKLGKVKVGDAFNRHMSKNLKYPSEDRRNEITGTVLVKIKLNDKGELVDYMPLKSPSSHMEMEVLKNLKDAPAMEILIKEPSYNAIIPVTFRMPELDTEVNLQSIKAAYGNHIVVTGYGTQNSRKFKPELPPMMLKLPIKLINNDLLNFDGQIIKLDKHLYATINKLLEKKGTDKENTLIVLSAGEDVNMGAVQTLQEALRRTGLRKIQFTATSRNLKTIQARPGAESSGEPLLVLDGVILDYDQISSIPVENIESVSVLKGKNASIYGANSKNGVILITSKEK
ncbi:MAG: TonB family protein [Cyclobacteriaceae bacterium]